MAEDINYNEEPSTYFKAISCIEFGRWITTIHEKMKFLHKKYTWKLTKLPKDKKIVKCNWIFKRKEGTPGVEKAMYKARLEVKWYSQILGVDFIYVFSPVMKHSVIRALLGIVAIQDLELEQLDVKTMFLHAELDEDIYMQQLWF